MRDIGVDVNKPEGEWDGSNNCPFYGTLRLPGQILSGVVSSGGMQDTVVVERQTTRYMKKLHKKVSFTPIKHYFQAITIYFVS